MADRWQLPLRIIELRADFERDVIAPFVHAYRRGLTPNPCVLCNARVKFGRLLAEARRLGAERLATGHYARIVAPDASSPRYRLYRGRDRKKDQSYFLHALTQEQLGAALFPLGNTLKEDVLEWALEEGQVAAIPTESQEICFIPAGHYREFMAERQGGTLSRRSGPIVDGEGREIGRHHGIFAYTIGQRRGLGIASTEPYYVTDLDPDAHSVRVGRRADLYRSEFQVAAVNWLSIAPPQQPISCQVRIRNQHREAAAVVTPQPASRARVRFADPQRAVTPGQSAVFYRRGMVLGGGVIMRNDP
jgi:tRNA-specific 2-thiouridylase